MAAGAGMPGVRVYQLAKELRVQSALIVELLDRLGKEVHSDLSSIDDVDGEPRPGAAVGRVGSREEAPARREANGRRPVAVGTSLRTHRPSRRRSRARSSSPWPPTRQRRNRRSMPSVRHLPRSLPPRRRSHQARSRDDAAGARSDRGAAASRIRRKAARTEDGAATSLVDGRRLRTTRGPAEPPAGSPRAGDLARLGPLPPRAAAAPPGVVGTSARAGRQPSCPRRVARRRRPTASRAAHAPRDSTFRRRRRGRSRICLPCRSRSSSQNR